MKFISILLICILPLVSCQPNVLPAQVYADMPIDPEPVHKPDPPERGQRREGLSNAEMAGIAFVTAAVAWAAWQMSSNDRGDCNDCRGDGIVHKGDPHVYRIRVYRRAYRCPVCEGLGHL